MPGIANILSIDLRSNPPQQQQRGSGEDSFSSMLQTNSEDVQNEASRAPQRERPDRPDNSERPVTARTNHRRAPDRSSPKNDAQTDAPKSDEADSTSAKDSPSKTDDTPSDAGSDTNNQQASTDTQGNTTVLVAPPAAPAVDPAIQIAANLNLGVDTAAASSVGQSDGNAGKATTPEAAGLNAPADVATSAAAAIADAAVSANATAAASATANEPAIPAAIAGLPTTTDTSATAASTETAEVPAPVVSDPANQTAAGTKTATDDLAIQIAANLGSSSNTKKVSGDTPAGTVAKQDGTTKTTVTNTTSASALPEMIAAAESSASIDTPKVAAPIKGASQSTGDTPAAQTVATEDPTVAAEAVDSKSDTKNTTANAALHATAKASPESEIDLGNATLRFDPALIRHLPQANPTALMAEPMTLNPATGQIQAQTAGTAAQPIPLTSAAIAVEIVARAKDGSRQFEIRLDPPELGRIDVRLDVDKSGEVSTRLTADRQETLDLLQRDSRELERALQSAGLKTNDGDLSFSLRQQTADGSANDRAQTQANTRASVLKDDNEQVTASVEQYQWAARLRGGVDIRI